MTSDITKRSIVKLPYDDTAIPAIAALFEVSPTPASFQHRGQPVLQLDVPSDRDDAATRLTFWTALHRVDAISEHAVAVFTNIATVELVEGVEALFRRESGEYLIVARGGKIMVRS
jgi:NADPH-dependent ferric siderophore reductase